MAQKNTTSDFRSIRIVRRAGLRAEGYLYGTIVHGPLGWRFVSATPHRRGSRQRYATPGEAFPSWIRKSEVDLVVVDPSLNAASNMGWRVTDTEAKR